MSYFATWQDSMHYYNHHSHAFTGYIQLIVFLLLLRPDSSLRYRRYINHLLTYLLTVTVTFSRRFW